jgi:hypothetical protein
MKKFEGLPPMRADQVTARHRLFIQYLVHGCDNQALCDKINADRGQPLHLRQACELVGLRVRRGRNLLSQSVIQELYNKELETYRNGHRREALEHVISIMRELGEGKAADRTVRLKAAQQVLGAQEGGAVNLTVNDQRGATVNNGGVHINAGYVIRLPAVETKDTAPAMKTIEAAPVPPLPRRPQALAFSLMPASVKRGDSEA